MCIHRPTGRRAELIETVQSLGVQLPQPTIVVSAALLLATGEPLTVDDLALLARYESRENVRRILDAHARVGVLVPEGGAYRPTDAFAAVTSRVLELQVRTAEWLWRDHEATVERLVGLTAAAIDSAVAHAEGPLPAFDQQRRRPEPASSFGRVLRRVTVLRYLRSDVHASALLSVMGLAGPDARAFDESWRRGEVPADQAALRHDVERVTNERFAALVADVDGAALLDALSQLPGEDPRDDLLPLPATSP